MFKSLKTFFDGVINYSKNLYFKKMSVSEKLKLLAGVLLVGLIIAGAQLGFGKLFGFDMMNQFTKWLGGYSGVANTWLTNNLYVSWILNILITTILVAMILISIKLLYDAVRARKAKKPASFKKQVFIGFIFSLLFALGAYSFPMFNSSLQIPFDKLGLVATPEGAAGLQALVVLLVSFIVFAVFIKLNPAPHLSVKNENKLNLKERLLDDDKNVGIENKNKNKFQSFTKPTWLRVKKFIFSENSNNKGCSKDDLNFYRHFNIISLDLYSELSNSSENLDIGGGGQNKNEEMQGLLPNNLNDFVSNEDENFSSNHDFR